MKNLSNQKKLASKILDCGMNRVWINPERTKDLAKAMTREDIRKHIKEGNIKKIQKKGVNRSRARVRAIKRKYGHQKGHGTRKGKKGARNPKKSLWMKKIRALRRKLKSMKEEGLLEKSVYCKVYRKAKGGEYRSVAHLVSHMHSENLITKTEDN